MREEVATSLLGAIVGRTKQMEKLSERWSYNERWIHHEERSRKREHEGKQKKKERGVSYCDGVPAAGRGKGEIGREYISITKTVFFSEPNKKRIVRLADFEGAARNCTYRCRRKKKQSRGWMEGVYVYVQAESRPLCRLVQVISGTFFSILHLDRLSSFRDRGSR
jgi:hypothetical protein